MDVNRVKFGNFSVGKSSSNASSKSKKGANEAQTQKAQVGGALKFDVDGMFDAMNIAGMQNMVSINKTEFKPVNPSDYLSQDRISDIEAMMAEFDSGVELVADTIEGEFPGLLAADQKYTLAASVFAKE